MNEERTTQHGQRYEVRLIPYPFLPHGRPVANVVFYDGDVVILDADELRELIAVLESETPVAAERDGGTLERSE